MLSGSVQLLTKCILVKGSTSAFHSLFPFCSPSLIQGKLKSLAELIHDMKISYKIIPRLLSLMAFGSVQLGVREKTKIFFQYENIQRRKSRSRII